MVRVGTPFGSADCAASPVVPACLFPWLSRRGLAVLDRHWVGSLAFNACNVVSPA